MGAVVAATCDMSQVTLTKYTANTCATAGTGTTNVGTFVAVIEANKGSGTFTAATGDAANKCFKWNDGTVDTNYGAVCDSTGMTLYSYAAADTTCASTATAVTNLAPVNWTHAQPPPSKLVSLVM